MMIPPLWTRDQLLLNIKNEIIKEKSLRDEDILLKYAAVATVTVTVICTQYTILILHNIFALSS